MYSAFIAVITTLCADGNVPGAGLNTGVPTFGVLIVNDALTSCDGAKPGAMAMHRRIDVLPTTNGPVYSVLAPLGTLPSSV